MTESKALAPITESAAALAAEVVVKGDLRRLTEEQKAAYIGAVCQSLGLNPLTRPFELIILNGKEVLYPTKGCTDQLRASRSISVTRLDKELVGDLYQVTAYGRDASGREDSSLAAVSIQGLKGEALANAVMKCETKAKRRLTLSLSGLGWPDESEIESIPIQEDAVKVSTLADRVQARKAARIAAPTDAVGTEPAVPDLAAAPVDGPVDTVENPPVADTYADFQPAAPIVVVDDSGLGEEVEGEIVLDDRDMQMPAEFRQEAGGQDVAEDAVAIRERFMAACQERRILKGDISHQARKTWPGVASADYTARHWRGLAADLGVDL
jgi:hypothetical protein